ncbi:MAG: ABC transporter ATP-binding protein [Planctomycetota bacterium]
MLEDRIKGIKKGRWLNEYYSDLNRDEDAITGRFFDFRLFKRLLKYVKPYWGYVLAAFVSLVLVTLTNLAFPQILKIFINRYVTSDLELAEKLNGLFFCVIALIVVFALRVAASLGQTICSAFFGQKSMHDLRTEVFRHVLGHGLRFFGSQPVGRLLTRTTNDVQALNEMISNSLITLVGSFITIGIALLMMFLYSWKLTLLCLVCAPFLLVATSIFRKKVRESFRRIRWLSARMNAFLSENLSGIRIINLFRREKKVYETFLELNYDFMLANLTQVLISALFTPAIEVIGSTTKAVAFYFGSKYVLGETLEIGTLIAFFIYFDMAIEPVRGLAEQYNVFQGAMASSERVFGLLDSNHEIVESPNAVSPPVSEGSLSLNNVWFAYEGENWVLKDVSLKIKPGESIALVGATGAGKSSIINVICRFYDVQKGSVEVDGVDVKELSRAHLNSNIVLVPQDVFLFSDTIANNISLWDPEITQERIVEAAKYVNAHPFISALPDGYQTVLKERAAGLSVGQKQLIAFARALAHNPSILVLDEATSSIDTETEELIQDAMRKIMKGRTSIIVAHRLSTVRNCDRIVVMHRGVIREVGTHEELIALGGIYKRLYELQYKSQKPLAAS